VLVGVGRVMEVMGEMALDEVHSDYELCFGD
jgi:hypothetical protein